MLRNILYTALALVVFAGIGLCGNDTGKKKKKVKKNAGNSGEIVKVDADKGLLTVKLAGKKKKPGAEKEFKVTDKTTVTEVKGDEKLPVKANKVADLLEKDQFKAGTAVSVETEEDGATAKAITIGKVETKKKKKKKNDA
jgi:hypothetical protein